MNLNKIIPVFNNNGGSLNKQDVTDSAKKNDPAVKNISNIFDTDLTGTLDASELALIDKLAALDGNNADISINDLKLFSSLSGSAGDMTFGDLSVLKTSQYNVSGNTVNTFDGQNGKTSTTTIHDDGSVTKVVYSYDKSQTTIEYTSDYKMKSKAVTHPTGAHEEYQYNNAGTLIQKDVTLKDGSQTLTSYRDDGRVTLLVKKDTTGNLVSNDEYDYDEYGKKTADTSYDAAGNIIAKALFNSDGSQIKVKYDANGEIIQRDTLNRYSKPLTSFVKNTDGSTVSSTYEYPTGGTKVTTTTYDSNGVLVSQQVSASDTKGNKSVTSNGTVTQKDEAASDGTITTTVYKSKDVIDNVTTTDSKGNIIKIDYYSYIGANIDKITEKDSKGVLLGTGQYHYDDPTVIKYLDHFDASGKLLDKAIWNLDGTKTTITYNTTLNNLNCTLKEEYSTDNKLVSSLYTADGGCTFNMIYTYDIPNNGDLTVKSTAKDGTGVITGYEESIIHENGTVENNLYNNVDKTTLLAHSSTDKYGNVTSTLYTNNQITSVTKTTESGTVTSKDNYNYTNGTLSSVDHLSSSGKSTGTTVYDKDGNTQELDNTGKLISSRTTDKVAGTVTASAYTYLSNGDKIVRTNVSLNGKMQSIKTTTLHIDNSSETTIYDQTGYNIVEKDIVSADGKVTTNIYDTTAHKLTKVVSKDASGNVILTNKYTYATNGSVDHIDCYDVNNKLTQTIKYLANNQKSITNYDANGTITTVYDKDGNVISVG